MDLIEYLRLIRRRWEVLVVSVIAAAAAAWIATPQHASDSIVSYQAQHTLIRDVRAGTTPAAVATVTVLVKTGDVPRRVAARIGYTRNPALLGRDVKVASDEATGTITLTAVASSRTAAADLANAFGEETLAFLTQQARNEQQSALDNLNNQVTKGRNDIDALDAQIKAAATPQAGDLLKAERDAKLRQYGASLDQRQQLLDKPAPSGGYTTLEAASPDLATVAVNGGFSLPHSRPARAAIGGALGLFLGFAILLLLNRLDPHVRGRPEVEDAFHLPVIAEIPFDQRIRRNPYEIAMVTRPLSALAEAYRQLRSAVVLMDNDVIAHAGHDPVGRAGSSEVPDGAEAAKGLDAAKGAPKVVLVTSPAPGDGKTATVANLAVAFAETGRRVLILGCDFRRPQIHNYFDAKAAPGLSDVLRQYGGRPHISGIVQSTPVRNVRIVANGSPQQTFGDVAAVGRGVVNSARRAAEVVIIDSAPLLVSSDAVELIPAVDAVVLVCRDGQTRGEEAARAREMLTRLGAPVTGVALVGSAVPTSRYHRYYYDGPSDGSTDAPSTLRRRSETADEDEAVDATAGATAGPEDGGTGGTGGGASRPVASPPRPVGAGPQSRNGFSNAVPQARPPIGAANGRLAESSEAARRAQAPGPPDGAEDVRARRLR